MSSLVKLCKIHGKLTASECVFYKRQNYYECKICRNERERKRYAANIEKEHQRSKNKDSQLKKKSKNDKICPAHGIIAPKDQSNRHQCLLCKRERDKKYNSKERSKAIRRITTKQRWENNKEELKLYSRIKSKKLVQELHPSYVKKLISDIYGLPKENISNDLIEFQTAKMLIKRTIRNRKANDKN